MGFEIGQSGERVSWAFNVGVQMLVKINDCHDKLDSELPLPDCTRETEDVPRTRLEVLYSTCGALLSIGYLRKLFGLDSSTHEYKKKAFPHYAKSSTKDWIACWIITPSAHRILHKKAIKDDVRRSCIMVTIM
jgi:hypothetical protein